MHQNSEAKQPKETDEIKKKLESYAALHRRIDNQIERLENLEAVMGSISSPSFDGISGGGGDGTSKQERQVIQKVTLEETIRRMIADEDQERSELESLISEMKKPDEQTVLEMHYFDAATGGQYVPPFMVAGRTTTNTSSATSKEHSSCTARRFNRWPKYTEQNKNRDNNARQKPQEGRRRAFLCARRNTHTLRRKPQTERSRAHRGIKRDKKG